MFAVVGIILYLITLSMFIPPLVNAGDDNEGPEHEAETTVVT